MKVLLYTEREKVVGKSGLGKTHLMHSIGNYIIENSNLRVLYISSDKFVNDFINELTDS